MTDLSPAAQAVWEAFNEDEAGVFVDYGNKLAAALRAAADQVVPPESLQLNNCCDHRSLAHRHQILAIAAKLDSANSTIQEH